MSLYLPYLRTLESEITALGNSLSLLRSRSGIIPILEPAKDEKGRALRGTIQLLKEFSAVGVPIILVTNPPEGPLLGQQKFIEDVYIYGPLAHRTSWIPGFVIAPGSGVRDLQEFLKKYPAHRVAIIHRDRPRGVATFEKTIGRTTNIAYSVFNAAITDTHYISNMSRGDRILLRDGFNKKRNADYPEDEFFADTHLNLDRTGLTGFSDYQIIGAGLPSGGVPHAVALHLTYIAPEDETLRVRHFVSDRKETPADPMGKMREALAKLVEFTGKGEVDFGYSPAVSTFLEAYKSSRPVSLGEAKALSIRHHLATVAQLL